VLDTAELPSERPTGYTHLKRLTILPNTAGCFSADDAVDAADGLLSDFGDQGVVNPGGGGDQPLALLNQAVGDDAARISCIRL